MPRSNWKGVISFGLVTIPIVLYSTEETSEKVSFHQIDKRNNARIKYKRVNSKTGKEVPWENIIKGYEYNKDIILPVDENEIEYVAAESARTIGIENFIDENEIDFINVSKTYYLLPDKKGEKGYVILREALKESHKVGIAKVIISTKDYLAAVACYDDVLVLYLLRYQEEIKPITDLDAPPKTLKQVKATAQEVKIAKQLINSMSSAWNPKKYKNEYADIVHRWAEKKAKKMPITKTRTIKNRKETDNAANFIHLLKESLGQAKKAKPESKRLH